MFRSIYFIIFTNDHNVHTWIYFTKAKLGAFNMFKMFKQEVEVESRKLIKMLKIIMEKTKNTLPKSGAPKSLWNKTMNITNYLVNRLPIVANQRMNPM